jgi:hypothetical protein
MEARPLVAAGHDDDSEELQGSSNGAAMPALATDDEDVSLDELMISDSADAEDEQEETTDVHSALTQVAYAEQSDTLLQLDDPMLGGQAPTEPEDDEAAALAAATAAQEEAAQAAVRERDEASAREIDSEMLLAVEAAREAGASEAPSGSERAPAFGSVKAGQEADERDHAEALADSIDAAAEVIERDAGARPGSEPPPLPSPELDRSKHAGAPLPSFDIPEPAAGAAAESQRELLATTPVPESASADRVGGRSMSPLAPLSEIAEEDDDDAVTHIGLPVPEAANDYPDLGAGGFQTSEPGLAALGAFDELSHDTRRATTRVVSRIEPSQPNLRKSGVQERAPQSTPSPGASLGSPGVGVWFSGLIARLRAGALRAQQGMFTPGRHRLSWLMDNVVPPVSLVLFGSGLGAGIMLLQPDRSTATAPQSQSVQALKEAPGPKKPQTLIERAEAGDGEALFKITNMDAAERSSALTLALETGYQAQKLNEFNEFVSSLQIAGGSPAPNRLAHFITYAISPETMLPAFRQLSDWPGSRGPDIIFAIWEKAPGGSRAATLAHQLLHSADQRAKATPALLTALDLRAATSCEDYLHVLPAVLRDGDQRCSATLRALKHTDGCGDDGKQDCYACLREGTELKDALTAIEKRVPPPL